MYSKPTTLHQTLETAVASFLDRILDDLLQAEGCPPALRESAGSTLKVCLIKAWFGATFQYEQVYKDSKRMFSQ